MIREYLCQVVYEGQVGFLQLGSRQRGQRVGVVQLFAVVRGEQVWIQSNNMSGIYKRAEQILVNAIFWLGFWLNVWNQVCGEQAQDIFTIYSTT